LKGAGNAITPYRSSCQNAGNCCGDLGVGFRGQRRNEVDVRDDMKQIKTNVILSVLASAGTVMTLASVVGAGKKWAN